MNKDKFLEMLNNAEEDKYGRLYVIGEYDNKIYFGTITTICEDIFNMTEKKDTVEIYDRHFWEDDTLECYVVSSKHNENIDYKKRVDIMTREELIEQIEKLQELLKEKDEIIKCLGEENE